MLSLLVVAVATVTIGSYIWAVKGHFRSAKMPDGAKLISTLVILGAFFLAWLTLTGEQPAAALIAGLALQLGSNVLFWLAIRETREARLLAAFTTENPHCIVMTGPYRHIRHPFYTSYLTFWTGWSIATWSPWSLVVLCGLAVSYWRAAVEEEQKFAASEHAETYAAYRATTGRFLPRFFPRRVTAPRPSG